MLPEYSIALCTYNGAAYLQEQLDSFLAQSILPSELVVYDDCSTDSTMAILEEFAQIAPFRVIIQRNVENLGSTANFDACISRCSNDTVFCADQDDIWLKDKARLMLEALSSNPEVGLVFSNADLVGPDLEPLGATLWQSVGASPSRRAALARSNGVRVLLKKEMVTGATMAIRKSKVQAAFPIPRFWIHDAWIALVASMESAIVCLDRPLILYRQHGKQQVGATQWSITKKIVHASPDITSRYRNRFRALYYASKRLHSAPVRSNAVHLLQRYRISQVDRISFSALRMVLVELITLRYSRFSEGLFSAAKDILRRGKS